MDGSGSPDCRGDCLRTGRSYGAQRKLGCDLPTHRSPLTGLPSGSPMSWTIGRNRGQSNARRAGLFTAARWIGLLKLRQERPDHGFESVQRMTHRKHRGTTEPTLELDDVSVAQAGSYSAVVTVDGQGLATEPSTVRVFDRPTITTPPQSVRAPAVRTRASPWLPLARCP